MLSEVLSLLLLGTFSLQDTVLLFLHCFVVGFVVAVFVCLLAGGWGGRREGSGQIICGKIFLNSYNISTIEILRKLSASSV